MTSQLPTAKWYDYLSEPIVADAILDRIIHNVYKIARKGSSRRKEEVSDK